MQNDGLATMWATDETIGNLGPSWALEIDENDALVHNKTGPMQCGQQTKKYATWAPEIDESAALVQKSWPESRWATDQK